MFGDKRYVERWWCIKDMQVAILAKKLGYQIIKVRGAKVWKWKIFCNEDELLEIRSQLR